MNILITGGTGLIGRALCRALLKQAHRLTVLTRDPERARAQLASLDIEFVTDFSQIKLDVHFDAVINLAGEAIAQRWTQMTKALLIKSRVELTQQLVAFLQTLSIPPQVMISGSAIGFYGPHQEETLVESSAWNASFSHDLCERWEEAAYAAKSLGTRVVCLRTGIVLGKEGGILKKMRLPFLLGLGGRLGDGEQWMSWIHLDDMIQIILFCLSHPEQNGPINATSPNPVKNSEFVKVYGKVLNRPAFVCAPAFALRLILGQMAEELMLSGQKVLPQKLTDAQMKFTYPDLFLALHEIESHSHLFLGSN